MKYKIFAICDPEKDYAVRFADYVREHGNIPMDIHMFTGVDELVHFMKERPIEILLLAEGFLRDDTYEWQAETVILLQSSYERNLSSLQSIHGTEEGILQSGYERSRSCLPDGPGKNMSDLTGSQGKNMSHLPSTREVRDVWRYPRIYKYRSAREVIREVMMIYGEKEENSSFGERILKPLCKVIGVYSPVGRCFKTSFAVALGQILAKEKPVLYLSLEEFSGLSQIVFEKFESDISDLIYRMRQGEKDLVSRMLPMTRHIAALDYIPPCISGQELRGVTPEEWHVFLREIIDHSSYEVIIVDIGNGLGCLEDLLMECELIYMPVLGDGISKAKVEAFEMFLKMSGAERVSGRIRQIRLDVTNLPENRDRYLQQIVWSDVGDYARMCIKRDEL